MYEHVLASPMPETCPIVIDRETRSLNRQLVHDVALTMYATVTNAWVYLLFAQFE
jgi:hypothetical protein